jgi:phage/plasmid-like protein (TIGR03299 family)
MANATWNYGTGVNVEGLSTSEMLTAANLDWNVKTSPLFFGEFGQHEVPGIKGLYREDTNDFIDTFSNREVRNNKQIVKFFENLLNLADLKIETLGHINSRVIYASARMSQYDTNLKNVGDVTHQRIILTDSHQNNQGFRVYTHGTRLVCTNGMAQKVSQQVGIVSHTGTLNKDKARLLLNAAVNTVKRQANVTEFLAEKAMTIQEAQLQLITAFGNPEKSIDEQPAMVKTCLELFDGKGQGSELLSAYGTAYGLLQSVTEWQSHHSTAKSQINRFESILSGTYATKAMAFEKQLVRAYR